MSPADDAPATTKRTPSAKWPGQSSDGDRSANAGLLPLPMRGRFRHRRSAASPFHPGSLVDSRAEVFYDRPGRAILLPASPAGRPSHGLSLDTASLML